MWRRFKNLLKDQLIGGVSPEKLALTVSLGVVLGVFPLLGFSSFLCACAAYFLRLNQPVIHVINHMVLGVQLVCMPFIVKVGEKMFGLEPIPFNPLELPGAFARDPGSFLAQFGLSGLAGVAAWALAGGPIIAFLYYPLRRTFRKMNGFLEGSRRES